MIRKTMLLLAVLVFCIAGRAAIAEPQPGYFGADIADLGTDDARALGWAGPRGVKLLSMAEGGPAHRAGLWSGDVIDALDGVELRNKAAFEAAVAAKTPGAVVEVRAWRGRDTARPQELRVTVTLAAQPVAAEKQAPTGDAMLMLDTGGHMAKLQDIAFTPDGRQLVSAGDDKVIRVWDVETGKTVRTLLGEAAAGEAGKIYAMALSPDGKWLAVGGWFPGTREESDAIRLYDFASGRLVALLKGHESVVNGLAFSPDGRRLISGSADKTAIIWDIAPNASLGGRDQSDALRSRSANIAPVIAAPRHRLRGHTDYIYAVGFTPDGARAVTGSYDHDLRLWSVESGEPLQTMIGHQDKVRSLAVAPDGTIASGDKSGEIRLWNGKTGAFLKVLARQKTEVGSLSFSPDGTRLLSGTGEGSGGSECHVYDTASGAETVTYRGHDNVVLATAISPDGRWAATGGGDGQEIHIWDPRSGAGTSLATAERRKGPDGQPLTLSGRGQPVWAVGFSADGRRIGWGHSGGSDNPMDRGPLGYALTLPTGDTPLTGPVSMGEEAFRRAVAEQNGRSLQHRKGGNYGYSDTILDIKQDGRQVKSIERGPTDGYGHSAYSFTPDGETIISGGQGGTLIAYTSAGKTIGEFKGHEGDIWAVAPSPDGRYLVSGAGDMTLRLWNLKTRELLVTLYRGTDGEWVMWTPEGFFTGSPNAGQLVGWHINHGADHEAEFVRNEDLYKKLYNPTVVARTIALGSRQKALEEAGLANFSIAELLARPKPAFRINEPSALHRSGRAVVTLDFEPSPLPLSSISATIEHNGKKQTLTPNQVPLPSDAPPARTQGGIVRAYEIPLGKGENAVAIAAANDAGRSEPRYIDVPHHGEGALDKRGTLHILAIGTDLYPSAKPLADLRFASADACAFAEAVDSTARALHETVSATVLVNGDCAYRKDGEPTKARIEAALAKLANARATDTVVVFFAGHGHRPREGGDYLYLPTDAKRGEGETWQTSVEWSVIRDALAVAPGARKLLFLDTLCPAVRKPASGAAA